MCFPCSYICNAIIDISNWSFDQARTRGNVGIFPIAPYLGNIPVSPDTPVESPTESPTGIMLNKDMIFVPPTTKEKEDM